MAFIDGLSSGLDTTSIINQLMAIERRPVQLAQSRAATQDARAKAWKDIVAQVDKLRTATLPLLQPTTFTAAKAATTSSMLATATVSAGTAPGSVTFRVEQLATAHQIMGGQDIGATDTLAGTGRVAVGAGLAALGISSLTPEADAAAGNRDVEVRDLGGGQFEITIGSESTTVGTEGGEIILDGIRIELVPGGPIVGTARITVVESTEATTVAHLVEGLSGPAAVASAQILNIGTGSSPDRRVVFNSRTTGSAGTLMVGTSGLDAGVAAAFAGFSTLTEARDARIGIGSGAGAMTITRSSNQVSDLLPGVTVNLRQADPDTEVTITVTRDTSTAVSAVEAWVRAMNDTIGTIQAKTAYNAETNTAAALTGSSGARAVRQALADLLLTSGNPDFPSPSQLGLALDRTGKVTLDTDKLLQALESDPDAVRKFFNRTGSVTGDLSYVGATDATRDGTYEVVVTQEAAPAVATSADPFDVLDADELITVRYFGTDVSYQALAGQTAEQVAAGLNAALEAAGVAVTAAAVAEPGGGARLTLTSHDIGSSQIVSVRTDRASEPGSTGLGGAEAGAWRDHFGVDVAGTIGGAAATGKGALLTATEGGAKGLGVRITGSGLGAIGTVTYARGFGGAMSTLVSVDGNVRGTADREVAAAESQKSVFEAQVGAYERRLALTEARLRKQFAALETMLGQLQGQATLINQAIIAMTQQLRA